MYKRREMGVLGKIYLCTYNLLQTVGWSVMLYILLTHYTSTSSVTALWDKIYFNLYIFQCSAFLEVIHASIGLVRSNPLITFIQVLSRIGLCVILLIGPPEQVLSSIGFPICILAWSITEIIRYSYYFGNLIGYVPYFLTYLRYTLFIVLYPLGVSGELICYYTLSQYSKSHSNAYTYALPNKWNFTFNFYYFLICTMLTYFPLFPHLYMHMFSQRKKILGSADKTKKKL